MKKFFLVLLFLIVMFAVIVTTTLAYYGLFEKVVVKEGSKGPYVVVCAKHVGDYSNVNVVMDEIFNTLVDKYQINTTKGFGMYYDDPSKVDKEKLRSLVGCVVETKTEDELKALITEYKVVTFSESNSIFAEFPFKGFPSIILGVIRVYPVLIKYMMKNNIEVQPMIELYDQPAHKTEYIVPIDYNSEFYKQIIQ